MHGCGKSDRPIVPGKLPNNGSGAPLPAEEVEGRGLTKGNPLRWNRFRTQRRGMETSMDNPKRARSGKPWTQPRASTYPPSSDLQSPLQRIRQAACQDKGLRFTTLWHHVYTIERLREAYFSLKQKAAPGVDGETWEHYGEDLEQNLKNLSERLKRGAYHAKPVRRVYIPKPDGRQRPLGVPTLEDKLVQRATTEVLSAIYEADFKGFSYGFRPGRSPHHALDALYMGISTRRVSWVLDADIRGFFDAIDHGWMMKFIEHRIADQRVVRHIKKWLTAGVLEDGVRTQAEQGTPQGGSSSPPTMLQKVR
jgi:RNA-directed DNA polymerase